MNPEKVGIPNSSRKPAKNAIKSKNFWIFPIFIATFGYCNGGI